MLNHFSIIFGITSYIFSAMGYFLNPAGYIIALIFASVGVFMGTKAIKRKGTMGLIISSTAFMLSALMTLLVLSFTIL